jgi:hypothetical protein
MEEFIVTAIGFSFTGFFIFIAAYFGPRLIKKSLRPLTNQFGTTDQMPKDSSKAGSINFRNTNLRTHILIGEQAHALYLQLMRQIRIAIPLADIAKVEAKEMLFGSQLVKITFREDLASGKSTKDRKPISTITMYLSKKVVEKLPHLMKKAGKHGEQMRPGHKPAAIDATNQIQKPRETTSTSMNEMKNKASNFIRAAIFLLAVLAIAGIVIFQQIK